MKLEAWALKLEACGLKFEDSGLKFEACLCLGIDLSGAGAKELKEYMLRLFERDSFQASLTEAEREIRA